MHRSSPLLPTVATALLLVALPGGLHAQAMDKTSKDTKSTMGTMKDTSAMAKDGAMMDHGSMDKAAMSKDGMAKDGMAKDAMQDPSTQQKTKARTGTKATGTMAEPAKMSHP